MRRLGPEVLFVGAVMLVAVSLLGGRTALGSAKNGRTTRGPMIPPTRNMSWPPFSHDTLSFLLVQMEKMESIPPDRRAKMH